MLPIFERTFISSSWHFYSLFPLLSLFVIYSPLHSDRVLLKSLLLFALTAVGNTSSDFTSAQGCLLLQVMLWNQGGCLEESDWVRLVEAVSSRLKAN
jgi:hypothetical protein